MNIEDVARELWMTSMSSLNTAFIIFVYIYTVRVANVLAKTCDAFSLFFKSINYTICISEDKELSGALCLPWMRHESHILT